jgi:outer membrane scaffolding protein for murein synthesis (MipA/OmpV family)
MKRIALAAFSSVFITPALASESAEGDEQKWKIVVGGGVASVPRYEGGSTNRYRAVPVLDMEKGNFFAGVSRGVGYNFSNDRSLQYGIRLTLAHARYQNADPRLNGMGDIRYTGEAGAFVSVDREHWYGLGNFATSSNGVRAELGGGFHTRLSELDTIRIGAMLDWGNGKYNQTFFGVTAAQAAASGNLLTAYNASSGVKDYGVTASWMHSFDRNWFSNVTLTAKQLSGAAKSSPLTTKTTMSSGAMTVGYRF